jgi:Cd2+/Zn2+-exporting ATPase
LIIKVLIFLLVIPGWLTLWLAVAADMGSSLLVTLNGMRLLRVKTSS